jgi:hypothetical protein
MQLINDRKISEAIRRTNALSPRILEDNKHLALLLKIQEFVELFALIKGGNVDEFNEYLAASPPNDLDITDTSSSPIMEISAGTSTGTQQPQQQARNKRVAQESLPGEPKRRSNPGTYI